MSKRPAIRFSSYANDWNKYRLGDIADIIGGGTPSTNNSEYWDGDIDWYAPAEMQNQRYAMGSVRKITELGLQKSSAKVLPAHRTVLFTSRAGIGKMAILKKAGCTNQGFQSLVLKDGYNPYFVYSIGTDIKGKAESVASGSTFLEISGKMLGNIEVNIPDISEQNQIAEYFERLDDLISFHQGKYDKLLTYRKAMLEKLFPKDGADVPEVRFAGFKKAWPSYKIDDIVSDVKRPVVLLDDATYQLVTVKRRNEGIVSRGSYAGKEILVKTYFEVREGDYLISKRQIVHGANGLVPNALDRAVVSNEYLVVVSNDTISTQFWTLISKTPLMYKLFFVSSYGVDIEKLVFDVDDWKARSIRIPERAEQDKLVAYFDQLDHLITSHQEKIDRLKKLKHALLKKMFV